MAFFVGDSRLLLRFSNTRILPPRCCTRFRVSEDLRENDLRNRLPSCSSYPSQTKRRQALINIILVFAAL